MSSTKKKSQSTTRMLRSAPGFAMGNPSFNLGVERLHLPEFLIDECREGHLISRILPDLDQLLKLERGGYEGEFMHSKEPTLLRTRPLTHQVTGLLDTPLSHHEGF